MRQTREQINAARRAADERRRDELRRQLAEIESANTSREEYAKREERIRLSKP